MASKLLLVLLAATAFFALAPATQAFQSAGFCLQGVCPGVYEDVSGSGVAAGACLNLVGCAPIPPVPFPSPLPVPDVGAGVCQSVNEPVPPPLPSVDNVVIVCL